MTRQAVRASQGSGAILRHPENLVESGDPRCHLAHAVVEQAARLAAGSGKDVRFAGIVVNHALHVLVDPDQLEYPEAAAIPGEVAVLAARGLEDPRIGSRFACQQFAFALRRLDLDLAVLA